MVLAPKYARFLCVLAVFLLFAAPVVAQTSSSSVVVDEDGVLSTDLQGPSAGAAESLIETVGAFTLDFGRAGIGSAKQRPDGIAAVLADGLFANGNPQNSIVSSTLWTDSATNTTAGPIVYEFDFLITPPSLRIGDFAGLEETDISRPDVSFDVEIRANGVPVFQASAHLIGGFVSHVLNETGTSLSPTFVGGGSVFGYDFQAYADVLNLGSFNPGETVTVEYEMTVSVDTPGFEAGGRAQIGDPFDLDGTPGFTGTFIGGGVVATESSSFGKVKSLFDR